MLRVPPRSTRTDTLVSLPDALPIWRLEKDGVARCHCEDRGHRYRHERRVPWNDNPDHSDRLVPRISKAVDAEGLAAGAFDLVGPAGIIANPRQGETARIARQRRADRKSGA